MTANGFYHKGSFPSLKGKDVYELGLPLQVCACLNANIILGKFIAVENMSKPVYVFVKEVFGFKIVRLEAHLSASNKSGKVNLISLEVSKMKLLFTSDETSALISNGKETYAVSVDVKFPRRHEYPKIRIEDLLQLVAGEISWKNLQGRSWLEEQRAKKELSAQEKLRNFSEKNKELREQLRLCEKDSVRSLPDFLKKVLPKLLCPFLRTF